MEWSRAFLPTNALYDDELFIVRCLPTMPSFVRCLTAMPSCEQASRRTLPANTPSDGASDRRFRRYLFWADASDAAFGRTLPLDERFLCAFRADASDVRRTVPTNASGAASCTAFLPHSLHHPALTRLHAWARYAHSQISACLLSAVPAVRARLQQDVHSHICLPAVPPPAGCRLLSQYTRHGTCERIVQWSASASVLGAA